MQAQLPEHLQEQLEVIGRGATEILVESELVEKLKVLYQQYLMGTKKEEKKEEPVAVEETVVEEQEWKDPRSFFEKYSIPNIIREIQWRLNGRKE